MSLTEKDAAFAAALKVLFDEWPLADPEHKDRRDFRKWFLGALKFYRDPNRLPVGMLAVPTDQLFAVHTLIYG